MRVRRRGGGMRRVTVVSVAVMSVAVVVIIVVAVVVDLHMPRERDNMVCIENINEETIERWRGASLKTKRTTQKKANTR
jgi:hypothetical protein